jgi:hypothetical protein
MFCEYKNIFGKPNEGVHKYRIFGMAAIDWIATIAAAALISSCLDYSFWACLLVLFIISIALHALFCVDTAIMKQIKTISTKLDLSH